MQLKTEQVNNKWRIYFNDPWGEPVGFSKQWSQPMPLSVHPTCYETREEAEEIITQIESYIMKHHQETKRKKKR